MSVRVNVWLSSAVCESEAQEKIYELGRNDDSLGGHVCVCVCVFGRIVICTTNGNFLLSEAGNGNGECDI